MHAPLSVVVDAAGSLADGLVNPTLLVTLHRDIDDLSGRDGRRLGRSTKQHALRFAIFTMSFSAIEAFFTDVLRNPAGSQPRTLPLNPDKLRGVGKSQGVNLFTNDWGVRTRAAGTAAGNRSRWVTYVGTGPLRDYLADMKNLRDLLSHGKDPRKASNISGALWPLKNGEHSMRLMGAEGFIQAACDLAGQTVLAYGGVPSDFPAWPEPARSGLSAEPRPALKLLD